MATESLMRAVVQVALRHRQMLTPELALPARSPPRGLRSEEAVAEVSCGSTGRGVMQRRRPGRL
jgi:hypothetical protein